MIYKTYFEIGGQLIENELDIPTGRPHSDPLMELAKKHGVPKPMAKHAVKQLSKDTGYDVERAVRVRGRLRRARWAFRTAVGLAAVDGPLPFGDIAAIGVLGVYGAYEIIEAGRDTFQ